MTSFSKTSRSSHHRAIAVGFVAIGIALNLFIGWLLVDRADGWWGDFAAYFLAAQRLSDGFSPYEAAELGTTAMLLIPATLWYHYLAVVLPFAFMAWPRASSIERAVLGVGIILTSSGVFAAGFATGFLGAGLVLFAAGLVVWRMTTTAAPYHRPDEHVPAAVA